MSNFLSRVWTRLRSNELSATGRNRQSRSDEEQVKKLLGQLGAVARLYACDECYQLIEGPHRMACWYCSYDICMSCARKHMPSEASSTCVPSATAAASIPA
eukprot:CAMPEP_0174235720 /NCGR_PEP_ID=MMETSP0417-20130205/5082_1 /TAXON_ID=242541 /ORGANISM="Mayorella sp, Strain BSH-02190019" /LENGTH=100 /DNA_ID=CAMNT_0015314265 /DNA_START=915 /DNA_END=1214 /DNA_ORIENTATION=-